MKKKLSTIVLSTGDRDTAVVHSLYKRRRTIGCLGRSTKEQVHQLAKRRRPRHKISPLDEE